MTTKRIRRACNICYLPVESPLKCNDCTFECCDECILTWTEKSRKCPQCRKYRTFDIDYPNSETESVGSEMEVPFWITQVEIENFLHLIVHMPQFPPPPPPSQFDEFGQYIDEDENEDENEDEEVNYYEVYDDDDDDDDDENEYRVNYEELISSDSETSSSSHNASDN